MQGFEKGISVATNRAGTVSWSGPKVREKMVSTVEEQRISFQPGQSRTLTTELGFEESLDGKM